MQVLEIRVFEGPNVHSFTPVIQMDVDLGSYKSKQTSDYPEFIEKLLKLLPGLREHHCAKRRPGGFVERLSEGTLFGHVIEHVALEIQAMGGMEVIYGKTRRSREGVYRVVFEYESREAALLAGKVAVSLVESLLDGKEFQVQEVLKEIERIRLRTELGPSTRSILEVARRRGIPCFRIGSGSLVQLGYGKNQRRVLATTTSYTSSIGVDIACDKELTKELLREAGIPVPDGEVVGSEKAALEAARRLGVPVVVKPLNGCQGKGVSLNLRKKGDIRRAFRLARKYADRIIVERYVEGRHFRVLVVGDRVVAAAERIPAHVVGDGESTIARLIEETNRDPIRGEGHEKPLTRIKVDPIVMMVLARHRMTLESIPEAGQVVFLRDNANLSTGGIAVDATDELHPATAGLCTRATRVVGLDVAGVDIVVRDISDPLSSDDGAVIEINAAPGIRMHHHPTVGRPRDAAGAIVDHLFPSGAESRIPVVAITGTNGKTTVTRLIAHALQAAGQVVGMATSDGVTIAGETILHGDTTGPRSARTVLQDPRIDVAVLETARGGILRSGLGFERCEMAVVTNLTEDHLGQDGVETLEDLRDVKALVVESVIDGGCAVLNADDPLVVTMARLCPGSVAYFSQEPDNLTIRKHVARGGSAAWVRDGVLVAAARGRIVELCRAVEIPLTHGGKAAHNLENCLAAALAVLSLGVSPEVVARALREFSRETDENPGRLNLFQIAGLPVILDYGHNLAGFAAITATARKMGIRPLIGVVCLPGDRANETILRCGRLMGKAFDQLVIKEDADPRGRKRGEVARLIFEGAIQGGMPEEKILIRLVEEEAVEEGVRGLLGLRPAEPGSTRAGLVVFHEKMKTAVAALERAGGIFGCRLLPVAPGAAATRDEPVNLSAGDLLPVPVALAAESTSGGSVRRKGRGRRIRGTLHRKGGRGKGVL